jgi:biopolymer transport protein TolR
MQAGSGGPSGGGGGGSVGAYRPVGGRRAPSALGEINVTPLVDVVLVLLLVFMITAPMMSRSIDVQLPVAEVVDTDPTENITVSINAEGRVYLGDTMLQMPVLQERLRGMMASRDKKVVMLKADENVRYGAVIAVIDGMKQAGVETFGLAYETPKERAARTP